MQQFVPMKNAVYVGGRIVSWFSSELYMLHCRNVGTVFLNKEAKS
jgi:hypothetical protein